MGNHLTKILKINTIVLIISGLLFAQKANSQDVLADTLPLPEYELVIAGVGDIMMGTSFPSSIYLPPENDALPLIAELIPYLSDADVTFGNLEGPFSDNAPLAKKCRDTTICYAFRMPELYAGVLDSAGFDILSLANNHFGDFGDEGRNSTMRILDSLSIRYAGLDKCPWSIFEIDSVIYGFCAFAPNKGTININDYEVVKGIVKTLSDTCDIVIVSFHGGGEGADYQHVYDRSEEFYGENRGNVIEFAHMVIDNGADIVFGHGPHVTRAIEVYNDRFIAYSLGNFLTYRRFNLKGANGISPLIKVSTDRSGKFTGALIVPLFQDAKGHVRIDPDRRVIGRIRELVKSDFPSSELDISDNGIVKLKKSL